MPYKDREVMLKHKRKEWAKIKDKKNKERRNYRKKNPLYYKAQKIKSTYGISLQDFYDLLKKQKNKCAICRKEFISSKDTHIDHNHKTGEIRKMLCSGCNLGLGHFRDSVKFLRQAIKYLGGF